MVFLADQEIQVSLALKEKEDFKEMQVDVVQFIK